MVDLARTYGRRPDEAAFAQMWAQLSPAKQRALIAEVQSALREVKNTAPVPPEPVRIVGTRAVQPTTPRQMRAGRSGPTVLNSARKPGGDDPWERLAELSKPIENDSRAR